MPIKLMLTYFRTFVLNGVIFIYKLIFDGQINLLHFCSLRSFSRHLREHAAVNRRVVGSSPTGGAIKSKSILTCFFLLFRLLYI